MGWPGQSRDPQRVDCPQLSAHTPLHVHNNCSAHTKQPHDPNHKRLFRSLVLVHNFDCYLLHRVLVPQPAARDSSNKSTANHFPSSPIHVSESRRLFPIKYLGHSRLPIFVFFFQVLLSSLPWTQQCTNTNIPPPTRHSLNPPSTRRVCPVM